MHLQIFFLFFLACVPKNLPVTDHLQLADRSYNNEKYGQAVKLYTTFLLKNPQHPHVDKAIFHLGMISLHKKNYKRAFSQFLKIFKQHPQSDYLFEAKRGMGLSYFYLQQYAEAIPYLKEYCSFKGENNHLPEKTLLADAYYALKDYQKALGEYSAIQISSQTELDPKILYQISLCQIHLLEYEQATANLTKLLSTDFGQNYEEKIYLSLAEVYSKNNLLVEAVESFLKVIENTKEKEKQLHYQNNIAGLIKEMSEEQLFTLIEGYSGNYPADIGLIALGHKLEQNLQLIKAKEIWEQFQTTFPNHERKESIVEALNELDFRLSFRKNKLGCLIPSSGDFSFYGDKVVKGIKLALEEYNSRTNSEIQLIIIDSKGDPEYGRNGLSLLLEKEEIFALIGPLLSSVAYAISPVINDYGLCTITSTATGNNIPESSPYFFRNCLTNRQQGKAIAEYAINSLLLKRFGILYPYNPYGLELMKIFADNIEKLGGIIEIIEYYEEGDTDFRHQLERINRVRPEALFVPGYPEEVVLIAPQVPFYDTQEEETEEKVEMEEGEKEKIEQQDPNFLRQEELIADTAIFLEESLKEEKQYQEKPPIQLLGCDGWYSEQVITHGGKYVEGAIFTCGFFKESEKITSQDFINNYQNKCGDLPDLLSAQAYDATNIIFKALEHSNDFSRDKLREALSLIDFQGITGLSRFSASGEALKEIPIISIKKGRFVQPVPLDLDQDLKEGTKFLTTEDTENLCLCVSVVNYYTFSKFNIDQGKDREFPDLKKVIITGPSEFENL